MTMPKRYREANEDGDMLLTHDAPTLLRQRNRLIGFMENLTIFMQSTNADAVVQEIARVLIEMKEELPDAHEER
ncbi:MAG: hypothetical protein GY737_00065 [Desulfobacteraceae bacterium]|nr:hypothetical protein [Desulfobacteraceae bacterium]